MSNSDNWRELAYDQQLESDSMKTEIKRYERQLDDALKQYNEEHRLRLIADMNLKFADEKLRKANLSTQPFEVDDDGHCECGVGSASLHRPSRCFWAMASSSFQVLHTALVQ